MPANQAYTLLTSRSNWLQYGSSPANHLIAQKLVLVSYVFFFCASNTFHASFFVLLLLWIGPIVVWRKKNRQQFLSWLLLLITMSVNPVFFHFRPTMFCSLWFENQMHALGSGTVNGMPSYRIIYDKSGRRILLITGTCCCRYRYRCRCRRRRRCWCYCIYGFGLVKYCDRICFIVNSWYCYSRP